MVKGYIAEGLLHFTRAIQNIRIFEPCARFSESRMDTFQHFPQFQTNQGLILYKFRSKLSHLCMVFEAAGSFAGSQIPQAQSLVP